MRKVIIIFLITVYLQLFGMTNSFESTIIEFTQTLNNINNLLPSDALSKELMKAIGEKDVDAALKLLKKGADPNFQKEGLFGTITPLLKAIRKKDADMVKLLLSRGADVNLVLYVYTFPFRALDKIIGTATTMTQEITPMGVKFTTDPIMKNIIELLIKNNAIIGWHTLELAIEATSKEILELLLKNIPQENRIKLINKTSGVVFYPLLAQTIRKRYSPDDLPTTLLEAGADPNLALEDALLLPRYLKLLLDYGANPNFELNNKKTLLMEAASWKARNSVKLLLDKGADPSTKDLMGLTALDYALKTQDEQTINLLRNYEKK